MAITFYAVSRFLLCLVFLVDTVTSQQGEFNKRKETLD